MVSNPFTCYLPRPYPEASYITLLAVFRFSNEWFREFNGQYRVSGVYWNRPYNDLKYRNGTHKVGQVMLAFGVKVIPENSLLKQGPVCLFMQVNATGSSIALNDSKSLAIISFGGESLSPGEM